MTAWTPYGLRGLACRGLGQYHKTLKRLDKRTESNSNGDGLREVSKQSLGKDPELKT